MQTEERNVWSMYIGDATAALQEIENGLLVLESDGQAHDEVHRIYRGLHTIKGNSSLLELHHIEALTHAAEDIVGYIRDGSFALDRPTLELMLGVVDVLRTAVASVAQHHRDVDASLTDPKLTLVRAWLDAHGVKSDVPPAVEAYGIHLFSDPAPAAEPQAAEPPPQPSPPATGPQLRDPPPPPPPKAHVPEPAANANGASRSDFIRLDARKVSYVMDLVGEIGLACSAVTHHPDLAGKDLDGFGAAAHKLEMMVRELQTEISAMRLMPIAQIFRAMKRVVRDSARRTGKLVELVISGEDTEIDKVMVEALHDPLVHLLRNAIDHGLEMPDERVAAGKPATGRILLDASHEGREVQVRVRDDGGGIKRQRVLARAVESGLVSNTAQLSDDEIIGLIFRPGFSTKVEIDELSGRGVGMDVIKTAVERLRGRVRVQSVEGKGSTIVLSVPLTMAFLDAMIVRDAEHLYAIPIEKVREVFTTREDQVCKVSADGRTGLRVRNELVPLMRLTDYYRDISTPDALSQGTVVVVVQTLRGPLAVAVDALLGNQPVMLKPLQGVLSHVRAAVGCGMLRTGDVALTLDCDRLDV